MISKTLSEEEVLAFDFLGTIQDGFELFLGRFECVVDVDAAEVVGEGGACFHAHEREGLVQLAPAYAPRVQRFEGLRVESASLLTALAHSLDQSAHRVGLRKHAGEVDGPGHAGVLGHGGEKIRDDPVGRTGALILIDVVSERRGHSG